MEAMRFFQSLIISSAMQFQNAEDVLAKWVSGVCTGQIDNIVQLYHDDAILIPTFSPHTVYASGGVRHYFEQLSTRDNLQVRLYEKSVKKQFLGGSSWVLSGVYAFEFEVDQMLITFPSRFTFALNLEYEKPILHHHSSQVPRNLS